MTSVPPDQTGATPLPQFIELPPINNSNSCAGSVENREQQAQSVGATTDASWQHETLKQHIEEESSEFAELIVKLNRLLITVNFFVSLLHIIAGLILMIFYDRIIREPNGVAIALWYLYFALIIFTGVVAYSASVTSVKRDPLPPSQRLWLKIIYIISLALNTVTAVFAIGYHFYLADQMGLGLLVMILVIAINAVFVTIASVHSFVINQERRVQAHLDAKRKIEAVKLEQMRRINPFLSNLQ